MKYTTLPYPIFLPFHPLYTKLNLYPYIFYHFKKSDSSFPKQINFCGTGLITMAFQVKLLSHCFSMSYSMVIKLSKMLLQFCTIWFVLRWILFQLWTKDCCKRKGVVLSSCFPWQLLLFIVKRLYTYSTIQNVVFYVFKLHWKLYKTTTFGTI